MTIKCRCWSDGGPPLRVVQGTMTPMVQQGMYFQNFQNAQKIDLLLLYVAYDVLICTAGYTDT